MAVGTYGVNDAMTVKQWSRLVEFEALKASPIAPLIGTEPDSIIHWKKETKKGKGDRVSYSLFTQLTGDGVTENETAEGNEESLTNYADSLVINELLHSVKVPNGGNKIDVQRVPFNLRENGKHLLRDWFAKRLSVSFFNHVCGNTAETRTKYVGLNATIAPSTNRIIYAGPNTGDQNLTSADTFDLSLIDAAKEAAQTATPKIKPINPRVMNTSGGVAKPSNDVLEEKYVMYLHPYQVTDLRINTSDGQWLDIQKAAMMSGAASKNPIFSGAIGEYNGVILRRADDVTTGCSSATPTTAVTTVRRAVLLGAQACAYATGQAGDGGTRYSWVEELFDYRRFLGISVQSLWGMKKCQFNSADYGTIVVSSYAVAHT